MTSTPPQRTFCSQATQLAITEGKYAGYSAILFKPASAFRYMDLPMEIRDRIQKMVLLPAEPVQIKNKSNARQQLTAVGYTAKNRLALLGVDKQIRAETFPLVYSKIAFSADSSNTLTKFLLGIGVNARSYLRDLSITNYAKKDIQMLFVLLADCTNISRLHIAKYPTGGTPAKIARAFSIDAGSWLSSRVTKSGKGLAIKPVRFGPRALMNGTKPFTDKDVALFFEELEKKI